MCLYVLSSVLLISLGFFVLSCYVSVYSEFRVAHFYSFVLFSCYVSLCSEFRVAHFIIFLCCPVMYLYVLNSVLLISLFLLCCPVMYLYVLSSVLLISLFFFVLSCYVSLCSEFRVAYFFCFFRVVLLCICVF